MVAHNLDNDFRCVAEGTTWMPSHGTVDTIRQTLDSNGKAVTSIMWRANRLVDDLAKSAAGAERLPPWIMEGIKNAANLVLYSAARLGTATHGANNHPITVTLENGSIMQKVVRDSTADTARPANRKKAAAGKTPKSKCPAMLSKDTVLYNTWLGQNPHNGDVLVPSLPPDCDTAVSPNRIGKTRRYQAVPTIKAPRLKKATAATDIRLREALRDETRVAQWIATRNLQPSSAESATARLQKLEARILAKRQARNKDE